MARKTGWDSLGVASRALGFAAALGFAILAVRFVVLVGATVVEYGASRPTSNPDAPVDRRRPPLRLTPDGAASNAPSAAAAPSVPAPEASGAAPNPSGPRPTSSSADRAPPEVRTLIVDVGPPRSRVYVNGRSVGQTPFAGQWSCAVGDVLLIQIIPENGAPLERHAICKGTTLSPANH